MRRDNPSPKPAGEIEAMRDRIAAIVTSGSVEGGSKRWHKLEAMEAALDWALGDLDGFPRLVAELEAEHDIMVNERKEELEWCCEELKEMTAVRPRGGGKTWNWPPHMAELGFGKVRLLRVQYEPNLTMARTLDADWLGDESDFTFRYCPFCGASTDGLRTYAEENHD